MSGRGQLAGKGTGEDALLAPRGKEEAPCSAKVLKFFKSATSAKLPVLRWQSSDMCIGDISVGGWSGSGQLTLVRQIKN
jgi:hypothetical protein